MYAAPSCSGTGKNGLRWVHTVRPIWHAPRTNIKTVAETITHKDILSEHPIDLHGREKLVDVVRLILPVDLLIKEFRHVHSCGENREQAPVFCTNHYACRTTEINVCRFVRHIAFLAGHWDCVCKLIDRYGFSVHEHGVRSRFVQLKYEAVTCTGPPGRPG